MAISGFPSNGIYTISSLFLISSRLKIKTSHSDSGQSKSWECSFFLIRLLIIWVNSVSPLFAKFQAFFLAYFNIWNNAYRPCIQNKQLNTKMVKYDIIAVLENYIFQFVFNNKWILLLFSLLFWISDFFHRWKIFFVLFILIYLFWLIRESVAVSLFKSLKMFLVF